MKVLLINGSPHEKGCTCTGLCEVEKTLNANGIDTEIIAASIRNPLHVVDAARVGCHIATIPYNVLIQMAKHPLTDIGIEKFLKDWESVPKK